MMSKIDIDQLLEKVEKRLRIGGEWRDGSEGETFEVENPATGETIATMASASREDALKALAAADNARAEWEHTTPRERAEILRTAYDLMHEHKAEFATLMSLEMGKTYAEAEGEVDYGSDYLLWFSEEANHFFGNTNAYPAKGNRMLTFRKPIGPCLLITPWNFPLSMATRKVAPALAAGNTVVVKPASKTPLTIQYFAQTMMEAGLPAGVINLVSTASSKDVSEPILADSRLRKLSFTGSTPVGVTLLKLAAENVVRTSMELGGNAPAIVFGDADMDVAVEGVKMAKMRNNAEACTAANRIFVHESVADEFTEKFVAAVKEMKFDDPFAEGADIGPLIDEQAQQDMQELVDDAVSHGGEILCGGTKLDRDGYFFEPTVVRGCSKEAKVYREEIFGPIAPIFTFKDEDELWELANDTEYGLASYVFSQNPDVIFRASDNLEFGIVGFNTGAVSDASIPFGGVKASGLGREGSKEGMLEYTEVQFVGMPDPYANN
ncbi:NAD-dependent succinate-semialdehyde dehydrogenase [Corynebacterium sp. CCUG 65737]|uniref:NAD-dependent succinate-semialdehyde dehydrogenase n=1 Tax=Corynebacterium sp. CCUG 65737 TaxID=2823889 RepID=UPI00210A1E94|nr:NAD-dependent succinate-semialdehyde dehydrogenase [Corynebacterium sp. CCUG 65737]MCQ4627218.1 NAD-dependent succinate-semialdehyde dehydrogenase [Corynebacterium sp. CCUG 65737]